MVYDTGNRSNARVTGWILYGLICGMLVVSGPIIWLNLYRSFYLLHRLMVILIIVFVAIHGANLAFIGIGLWGADLILRNIWVFVNRRKVHTATARVVGERLVELRFPKSEFRYAGGQYVFLMAPQISFWEPHPFSFSSAPHQRDVTIHIRACGDWTEDLLKKAQTPTQLSVYMDGPYGSPALDFDSPSKQFFVFIAGGVGVTPNLSYANSLLDQVVRGRQISKVVFVWTTRSLGDVSAVTSDDDLLFRWQDDISTLSQLAGRLLDPQMVDVEIYLSKGQEPTHEHPRQPAAFDRFIQSSQKLYLKELFVRLEQMRKLIGSPHGNVFCCGPTGMLSEVSWLAKRYGFSHHIEHFAY